MQPGRARTSGLGVPLLPLARGVVWVTPACPTNGVLVLSCPSAALRVCGVLGHLAPVHRGARSVRCFACAVSWAIWLLFTGVPEWFVALRVRCPGPLGSCSPVRPLGVLCCVWGVLAQVVPVHRRARCVWCACAVGGCVSLPPPPIFFFVPSLFFLKNEKTGGQLVQWWNSVVFAGVCRRCFGGSRSHRVRLARPNVHWYESGWVWLGASLL